MNCSTIRVDFLATVLLAASTHAQDALETKIGTDIGQAFGMTARPAGDVDKDGVCDFIVGAPGSDVGGADAGSVSIYSGVDSRLIYFFRGESGHDGFGYSVDSAGDVNGDGYDDIIVGAPHKNLQLETQIPTVGSAQVFSGRDGKLIHEFIGENEGEALGWSVRGIGDANRDGYADVAAGAPFYGTKKGPDIGRVVIYSGKTGKKLYELKGQATGDRFGWSICQIDDLDHDRSPEILIGVEGSRWRTKQGGSARLHSGRRGRLIRTLRTGEEEDYFGTDVANAGDVDGDGVVDLLVGAWNASNKNAKRAGVALVFSGKSGKQLLRLEGSSEHDRFGMAVAGIGDIDQDGHADLLVGAPQEQGKGSGYVRAFSGATGKILYTIIGEAIGDGFGTSLCLSPDRDDDGIPDLLIGSPGMGNAGGWKIFRSAAN